jgi:hypothetical protein
MRHASLPFAFALAALTALGAVSLAEDVKPADHKAFDALLVKYVDDKGLVDYKTWKAKDAGALDAYLKTLAAVKDEGLSADERLALWINAYNAITIKTVLDHYPIKSLKDVSDAWTADTWSVGGRSKLSLDDVKNKILRKMGEPRIHFAIVAAAKGGPFLRKHAFTADKIATQLEDQVTRCFADPTKLKIDTTTKRVEAMEIFKRFGDDFAPKDKGRLDWIAKHVTDPELRNACLDNGATLSFLYRDSALNER